MKLTGVASFFYLTPWLLFANQELCRKMIWRSVQSSRVRYYFLKTLILQPFYFYCAPTPELYLYTACVSAELARSDKTVLTLEMMRIDVRRPDGGISVVCVCVCASIKQQSHGF